MSARVSAVVVAAGRSTRMKVPKMLLPLDGKPVIVHTLAAFQDSAVIDDIVLVTRADEVDMMRDLAVSNGIGKLTAVVPGGATRQQSVTNGVRACRADTAFFAIHDGARPLVSARCIEAVVQAAQRDGAAAAAVRVKDTVKIADENGFVRSTPDRATLWSVQTPQIFERELYLRALAQAETVGLSVTDDCQLVEAIGHPVRLVESEYTNLKITTPEDIRTAEGWLR